MRMKCGCYINEIGVPPIKTVCTGIVPAEMKVLEGLMHSASSYPCKAKDCQDYRPERLPVTATDWPKCVCGEIAQEHG